MLTYEIELKALLASQGGDAAAYRRLLDLLSGRLRAYYRSKLVGFARNATEAEDLVQEALLAIHTQRHTYNPAEPLTPWVYAIARYKLIDHLRATRASQASVPIENADEVMAQDDHGAVESAHDLHNLLSRLPHKMRRAIECVKLDGLSVVDAASVCNMSEPAVKVNIHRGLRALAAVIVREKQAREDR
jgi:RNA polymerase sigma-70 factor (ECF subfamily)